MTILFPENRFTFTSEREKTEKTGGGSALQQQDSEPFFRLKCFMKKNGSNEK